MAIIPAVSDMSAPRTATARPSAQGAGDLGLADLAQGLADAAQVKKVQGQHEAVRAYDTLRTRFLQDYAPAAAQYDGKAPGFAASQINAWDQTAGDVRQGLSPDAKAAFEQLNTEGRVQIAGQAFDHEARVSEERVKQAEARQQKLQALQATGDVVQQFGKAAQPLVDAYDGSTPGFADHYVAAFDQVRDQALANAPEDAKPELQLLLQNERMDVLARGQAIEGKARPAWEVNTILGTSDAMVNAVISDPGQYGSASQKVDQLVAMLPGELQGKYGTELRDRLAVARVQGLAIGGQREQAIHDLNSGVYDRVLAPAHKEELLRTLQGQVDAQSKALNGEIVRQRVDAEVASLQATGVSTGLNADIVRGVLGPAEALKFQKKASQALTVYQATAGLEGLPRGDMAARVESLRPPAGDPDFDIKQKAYQDAQAAMATAVKLQETDPAKAAQAAPGVQPLFRAFLAAPTAQTASAYAQAALTAQAHMGIDSESQRLLTMADAKSLVHPVATAAPGQLAKVLGDLTTNLNAFGPYGGQVLKELRQSGLHADTAALLAVAGDDPIAVGQFARGIESAGAIKLDGNGRTALSNAAAADLEPFTKTLSAAPGGLQLTGDLQKTVETAAKGFIAAGDSPEAAAKKASAAYLARYQFSGTWRLPAQLAARKLTVAGENLTGFSGFLHGYAAPGPKNDVYTSSLTAAQAGAHATVKDLVGFNADAVMKDGYMAGVPGTGLMIPRALPGDKLTDDQRRRNYADQVMNRSQWVTTADDRGLMLVLPGRTGASAPVLDAKGQPVVRTWDQLFQRAAKR